MSQRALVFLDASVMVAASRSPLGGSAVAMDVCRGRRFRAAVSAKVLLEARMNIAQKFSEAELVRFYQQVAGLDPEVVPAPAEEAVQRRRPLSGPKDAHVLAAALECGAKYLLSLDRRHLVTPAVQSAELPVRVTTPGDFLERELTSPSAVSSPEPRPSVGGVWGAHSQRITNVNG